MLFVLEQVIPVNLLFLECHFPKVMFLKLLQVSLVRKCLAVHVLSFLSLHFLSLVFLQYPLHFKVFLLFLQLHLNLLPLLILLLPLQLQLDHGHAVSPQLFIFHVNFKRLLLIQLLIKFGSILDPSLELSRLGPLVLAYSHIMYNLFLV